MAAGNISETQQYHYVPLALLGFTSWVAAAPAITSKTKLEERKRDEASHIGLILVGKQTFHSGAWP